MCVSRTDKYYGGTRDFCVCDVVEDVRDHELCYNELDLYDQALPQDVNAVMEGGEMTEIHPEDLVLVAVMTDPRDLEIARVLGWYRIPVASAPKTLRVDWIAFYLTSAFGEEKWSIRYLARVRGHELVRRRELLRDEPDHLRANEPYFKIQLGPLLQLPRPIPSRRWRRFTFLYTTGEQLERAHEIKDLRVPSSRTRDLMLRERGEKV